MNISISPEARAGDGLRLDTSDAPLPKLGSKYTGVIYITFYS